MIQFVITDSEILRLRRMASDWQALSKAPRYHPEDVLMIGQQMAEFITSVLGARCVASLTPKDGQP